MNDKTVSKGFESIPAIIEQAAKSPLGLFALMVIALSIIGFFFFHDSSEWTRIGIFIIMFIGVFFFGIAAFRSMSEIRAANIPEKASISVNGIWKAEVKYCWGEVAQEIFSLKSTGEILYGTASFVNHPYGIFNGKITGDRITFIILFEQFVDESIEKVEITYIGIISGDNIKFILQDERGYPPLEFIAIKELDAT